MFFFFQAEDGIRDLVRSRGLGDVYKRQTNITIVAFYRWHMQVEIPEVPSFLYAIAAKIPHTCLLYTSDAADERSSVDLGGRRIIKKKTKATHR